MVAGTLRLLPPSPSAPDPLRLQQAEAELLAQELEIGRLRQALHRMARQALALKPLERATPFAFPLMIERLRERLSNESVADRIARMLSQLEKAAGGGSDNDAEQVRESLTFGRDSVMDPPAARTKGRRRSPRRSR